MRVLIAASAALGVALVLLIMGCASATQTETPALRSITLDLGAPTVDDAVAAEVGARRDAGDPIVTRVVETTSTTAYCGVYPRTLAAPTYGDASWATSAWRPGHANATGPNGLWSIGQALSVGAPLSGAVWVGNDAWGYYVTGSEPPAYWPDAQPSGGGTMGGTTAAGIMQTVFLRNETDAEMRNPWIELNSVASGWSPDSGLSWDTPHQPFSNTSEYQPSWGASTTILADWTGVTIPEDGEGGPGPAGTFPVSYDWTTYQDIDVYEQPIFFRYTGGTLYTHESAGASIGPSPVQSFFATVTIYWWSD